MIFMHINFLSLAFTNSAQIWRTTTLILLDICFTHFLLTQPILSLLIHKEINFIVVCEIFVVKTNAVKNILYSYVSK